MSKEIIKQGEDKKFSVHVIKNGLPISLSNCVNIKAIFKVNNVIQKKFSLVSETDYNQLVVDSNITNKVDFSIEREDSKNFPEGSISLILLPAFTDADFVDNVRVEEYKFILGKVIKGEGIEEIL